MLSWSNMASKTPSRTSKTPPKASKTPSRTSKTPPKAPPRRPQELPRRSEVLDFLCLFAGFSNIFRFVRHLGAILVQHGLQDAIQTVQDTSKSLQDALKNLQDAPKTPPRRPQEPAKRLSNSPPSLSDMPSLCQVRAKSLPDCQIRQRCMPTMVKHNGLFCEGRGRLPRVVWRWFARVGRLRSARTPWCFSGVFKMEKKRPRT